MSKLNLKAQSGVVMIMTLLILSSILIVTLAAGSLVLAGLKMNRLTGYSNLAFYASEAGMERALWEARKNNFAPPGENADDVFSSDNIGNGGSYEVNYATSSPLITFKSIGFYQGVKRSVEGSFTYEEPECAPDCAGKECGDDGCGGSCGSCGADESCVAGACQANPAAPGQIAYTTAGTYEWTVPAGVTSVSVVAVGGGSGSDGNTYAGGGGALGWKNNISVTPGEKITVTVGIGGGLNENGGASQFKTLIAGGGIHAGALGYGTGGTYSGADGGGNGGKGGYYTFNGGGGGGGAGGYTGAGGDGGIGDEQINGTDGSGGAAGGGAEVVGNSYGYGGGGVGLYGSGSSGSGGVNDPGQGGSGGNNGFGPNGGAYGGGAGTANGNGGGGACRIIWPGDLRQFPSTRTADE